MSDSNSSVSRHSVNSEKVPERKRSPVRREPLYSGYEGFGGGGYQNYGRPGGMGRDYHSNYPTMYPHVAPRPMAKHMGGEYDYHHDYPAFRNIPYMGIRPPFVPEPPTRGLSQHRQHYYQKPRAYNPTLPSRRDQSEHFRTVERDKLAQHNNTSKSLDLILCCLIYAEIY